MDKDKKYIEICMDEEMFEKLESICRAENKSKSQFLSEMFTERIQKIKEDDNNGYFK